jgi:hypothetical protein
MQDLSEPRSSPVLPHLARRHAIEPCGRIGPRQMPEHPVNGEKHRLSNFGLIWPADTEASHPASHVGVPDIVELRERGRGGGGGGWHFGFDGCQDQGPHLGQGTRDRRNGTGRSREAGPKTDTIRSVRSANCPRSLRRRATALGALQVTVLCLAGACQSSAANPLHDGSVERPSFDVLPLDGASAGYALSFDGVAYANAGDGGFAPVGSNQTIEMWVNCTDVVDTQDFLALRSDFTSGVQIGIHAGALAVWRVYVDRVLVQAPTTPSPNSWHHVAYTFDTVLNALYLDGAVVDSESNPTDSRTPTSAWLGTIDGSNNLFKGEIDEVRVWTVTRSASQVVADMQHSSGQGQAGLVAYWTFDDANDGGISRDLSGSGNDVTLGDGFVEWMPKRVPSDIPFGR